MNVITQGGIVTDLRWWDKMRVSGTSVVLDSERASELVSLEVAKYRTKARAEALFRDINEGIRLQKKGLSVVDWSKSRAEPEAAAAE